MSETRSATPDTLTAAERDLFPEHLHGTVTAIKREWYEQGKRDANKGRGAW